MLITGVLAKVKESVAFIMHIVMLLVNLNIMYTLKTSFLSPHLMSLVELFLTQLGKVLWIELLKLTSNFFLVVYLLINFVYICLLIMIIFVFEIVYHFNCTKFAEKMKCSEFT